MSATWRRSRSGNTGARWRSRERRARTGTGLWKKTWSCLKIWKRASTRTGRRCSVPRLTWPPPILIWEIRWSTGWPIWPITTRGTNGAFIPCMILPTPSRMPSSMWPTPSARWNSRITGRYMTGWSESVSLPIRQNRSSLPSCTCAMWWRESGISRSWWRTASWTAGMIPDLCPSAA